MTIDKAIEILENAEACSDVVPVEDYLTARRLGIEALKEVQAQRNIFPKGSYKLFPGETKDWDMTKFKVGDLARVHPKYQTAMHRSTMVGRIFRIESSSQFPVEVKFKTHYALFKPHELEKIWGSRTMIDIKCFYVNKTYRGQDFGVLYCGSCIQKNRATIKNGELTCNYLRYYESYKPKRRGEGQGKPGQLTSLPTAASVLEHKEQWTMKLESTKPTTPRERSLRRKAHSIAFLKGITMRQAVYDALELWINKHDTASST